MIEDLFLLEKIKNNFTHLIKTDALVRECKNDWVGFYVESGISPSVLEKYCMMDMVTRLWESKHLLLRSLNPSRN